MKQMSFFILILAFSLGLGAAIDNEQRLADLAKTWNRLEGKARVDALNELSHAHYGKSPQKCLEYASLALTQARSIKYAKGEAQALAHLSVGHLLTGKSKEAMEYANQSFALFEKWGDKAGMASTLNIIGGILYRQSQYEKSLEYYTKSIGLSEKIDDKKGIADSLSNMGSVYKSMGQYDRALAHHQRALDIRNNLGESNDQAISLNNIGNVLSYLGKYDEALAYYFKALKIKEEGKDKSGMAYMLSNIASVYKELGNLEESLNTHLRSLQIREELNDTQGVANSLSNIGSLYNSLGNLDKSLEYHLRAMAIREKMADRQGISISLINIGNVYKRLGRLTQALTYHEKSLLINREIGDKKGVAISLNNIGELQSLLFQHDKAISSLKEALAIATEIKAENIVKEILNNLAESWAARGNYQKAFAYHKKYTEVKDKIFTEESMAKIAEMKTRFETERKEKEIEVLKKENEIRKLKNRNQLIISFGVVLGLILMLFFGYRHYRLELIRREEKQKRMQQEAELKIYQSRINPHFLANALSVIIGMGYENNKSMIEQTVHNLSSMYRQILDLSGKELVCLKDELEVVKTYLNVEKVRFGDRLQYSVSVNDELKKAPIIPLCLEPIVENAVKHGLARKTGGGSIEIKVSQQNHYLVIKVVDSGVGFDLKSMKGGEGIFNVQERLKLYYKNKARLNITTSPGQGTEVTIEIPLA